MPNLSPHEIYQRELEARQQTDNLMRAHEERLSQMREGLPSSYNESSTANESPSINLASSYGGLGEWWNPPEQGGLGLAANPRQPEMSEGARDAQYVMDYMQGLGWPERVSFRAHGGPVALANQRGQVAARLEQLKQQQLEHQFDQAYQTFTAKDLPWSQRKKMLSAQSTNPVARIFSAIGDEKLAADFESLVPYLDPQDITAFKANPDQFVKDSGGLAGLEAKLEVAKERQKATVKDRSEQLETQKLIDQYKQDPSKLSDTDIDRLDKFTTARTERTKKLAELDLKLQQTAADIAEKQRPREVASGVMGPEGEVFTDIYNPTTGKVERIKGIPIQRITDSTVKMTPENAGRVAGISSGIKSLDGLLGTLVHDKKVDRQVLFSSAFGGLPFSGGRDIDRFIREAIELKIRLQTGATARPDELENEAKKFSPKQLDSDATIISKLKGLRDYYTEAFNVLDPDGQIRARLGSTGAAVGPPPVPFNQAYDTLKKQHPGWKKEQIFQELQRRGVQP